MSARYRPKYTFWITEGHAYGRVARFPTPEAFLRHRYNYGTKWPFLRQEQDGNVFFEDWRQTNPIESFVEREKAHVGKSWYRYSFGENGDLYLEYAKPGQRGSFELWEWEG